MPYHFTCPQCGVAFTSSQRVAKYCSYACSNLGRQRRVVAACVHCGVERPIIQAHAADPSRKFCSRACKVAATKTTEALARRFWPKVTRSAGCWLWRGMIGTNGYGRLRNGRDEPVLYAHRVSYELNIGPIPNGMNVCHRCDNPPCVRPDHLFLGSDADNMADKVAKGRQERGAQHHAAKLTESDVVEIRRLYRPRIGVSALAERFGVSRRTIHDVATGRKWAHIT